MEFRAHAAGVDPLWWRPAYQLKYYGEPGLDALRAMLQHADRYGLKWVFVRDPYYDPLLNFAGWRRVDELEDKTIIVWSKDGVPPATPMNAPQIPPLGRAFCGEPCPSAAACWPFWWF